LRKLAPSVQRFASSEFVRHGLLVFVASMAINVFGYGFHFAISRRVGVEQYGVLSALNSLLMVSVVLSQIAATIVVKYAAEFRATDDRAHLAALVRMLVRSRRVLSSPSALPSHDRSRDTSISAMSRPSP